MAASSAAAIANGIRASRQRDIDELIRLGEIGHVTRILREAERDRERLAAMQGIRGPDALDGEAFDFKRYASALEEVRGAHA